MLFFKRKKPASVDQTPTFTIDVPYSENFRGFKRIKLDAKDDRYLDIDAIKAAPTVDRIHFEEYQYEDTTPLIRVLADQNRLGTLWKNSYPDYYKMIKQGKCTAASIGFTEWGDVFLFVKFE